jgi:hypothetical protein
MAKFGADVSAGGLVADVGFFPRATTSAVTAFTKSDFKRDASSEPYCDTSWNVHLSRSMPARSNIPPAQQSCIAMSMTTTASGIRMRGNRVHRR